MAMTPQQARMTAMQLRARKPELQSMAVDDLISQIMMADGAQQPGAGVGGLANLFPRTLTAASPAPMEVARLAAPKPTAQIVPGVRAARPDPRIPVGPTGQTRVVRDQDVPLNQYQIDSLREMQNPQSSTVADVVAPVREEAPKAAPEAAPKPKFQSRFGKLLEQAQAELNQLQAQQEAATSTGAPVPSDVAYNLKIKSGEVSRLKGLVAAEEGAVVDADRAALLERQAARLGREEELVEQARKRAPGDALIAFGGALAGAKPGEKFASALTRGLQAGNESYTGARTAREQSLRGIEEKRDAYTVQRMDALDSARNKAIELANAGVALTKEEIALVNSRGEGALAETTRPLTERKARAEVAVAETEATYADELKQLAVLAAKQSIDSDRALAEARRRPPTGGSSGGIPKGVATFYGTLGRQATSLRDAINDPLVSKAAKANYIMQLSVVEQQMRGIETTMGFGGTGAPAAGKQVGRIISSKPAK